MDTIIPIWIGCGLVMQVGIFLTAVDENPLAGYDAKNASILFVLTMVQEKRVVVHLICWMMVGWLVPLLELLTTMVSKSWSHGRAAVVMLFAAATLGAQITLVDTDYAEYDADAATLSLCLDVANASAVQLGNPGNRIRM